MRHSAVSTVQKFIGSQLQMNLEGHYLVALSGGSDSVCLLLIMKQLGYSVEAIHCNFRLRGNEADRDEQFCADLCSEQHVPLHRIHFDTREYAALHHVSIEMAARQLRYHYFAQLCHDVQADAVCVGHHRDDAVETVLINLVRGTGIHGLTGISPRQQLEMGGRKVTVLRPLLCLSREDIFDFLEFSGQKYVTDSTNLHDDVVRNKIRLNVIPQLKAINPNASASIAATALHLGEAAKVVDAALETSAAAVMQGDEISVDALLGQPSPEYTLFHILAPRGFTPAQVEQIAAHIEGESGREYRSATHQLLIDRRRIVVEPIDNRPPKNMRLPEAGCYLYRPGVRFDVKFVAPPIAAEQLRRKDCAYMDASQVRFPLTVRPVGQGDRFHPYGMKGTQLVSDYMTNRRMSLFEKRRQLVVEDAEGRILWVVGERTAHPCRITEATRSVLLIALSCPEQAAPAGFSPCSRQA